MALAPEKIFTYLTARLPPASRASDPFFTLGNQFLVRSFVGRLLITLAYDAEEPLLLRHRDLPGLPLNAPQLFELGLHNLERLASSGRVKLHSRGAGFSLEGGGKFGASLLLLPGVWDRVRQMLGANQLLAVAPTSDLLMLARAEDPLGREELLSRLGRTGHLDPQHRLNDDTYLFDGTEWSVFSSPTEGNEPTESEVPPTSVIVERRSCEAEHSRKRA